MTVGAPGSFEFQLILLLQSPMLQLRAITFLNISEGYSTSVPLSSFCEDPDVLL